MKPHLLLGWQLAHTLRMHISNVLLKHSPTPKAPLV